MGYVSKSDFKKPRVLKDEVESFVEPKRENLKVWTFLILNGKEFRDKVKRI